MDQMARVVDDTVMRIIVAELWKALNRPPRSSLDVLFTNANRTVMDITRQELVRAVENNVLDPFFLGGL